MFNKLSKKYKPYDPVDISKEKENADVSAVFAKAGISAPEEEDFVNAPPRVYRPQKVSLARRIVPIAAAAAVIGAAVPFAVMNFANVKGGAGAASSGLTIDLTEVSNANVNESEIESDADVLQTGGNVMYFYKQEQLASSDYSEYDIYRMQLDEDELDAVGEVIKSVKGCWIHDDNCDRKMFCYNARVELEHRIDDGTYCFDFRNCIVYHICTAEDGRNMYGSVPREEMSKIIDLIPEEAGIESIYSVPNKSYILSLGKEKALALLSGIPVSAFEEAWGNADGQLSGMYGLIWDVDLAKIIVYFDGEGYCERVLIDDQVPAGTIDEAVDNAIKLYLSRSFLKEGHAAAGHVILNVKDNGDNIEVAALTTGGYYKKVGENGENVENVSGYGVMPMLFHFVEEKGGYVCADYTTPNDGQDYFSDVMLLFPDFYDRCVNVSDEDKANLETQISQDLILYFDDAG